MNAALKIKLPNPCQEDWNKMTPAEQGRFCSACEKIVIDFTELSDQELIDFFVHSNKKACGRFASTQLDRLVIESKGPKSSALFPAIFSILLSIGSLNSFGQNQKPTKSLFVMDRTTGTSEVSKIIYSGKVNSDSLGLARVEITVEGANVHTYSDHSGYFVIELPEYVQNRNYSFRFSKPGFLPQIINTDQLAREFNVELVPIQNSIKIFEIVDSPTKVWQNVKAYAGVPVLVIEPKMKPKWWQFWKRIRIKKAFPKN